MIKYKIPDNYLSIENVDEDNTLIGDEDFKIKPSDDNQDITEGAVINTVPLSSSDIPKDSKELGDILQINSNIYNQ